MNKEYRDHVTATGRMAAFHYTPLDLCEEIGVTATVRGRGRMHDLYAIALCLVETCPRDVLARDDVRRIHFWSCVREDQLTEADRMAARDPDRPGFGSNVLYR